MNSFEDQSRIYQLNNFKDKLCQLKGSYDILQQTFNNLCDLLDVQTLNEHYIEEICNNMTIYLADMERIEKKIKDISEIIENIKLELSN